MAAFSAQNEADLTLPECAVVEIVTKSLTGWWKVRLADIMQLAARAYLLTLDFNCRYGGSTGLAPASLLALTDINSLDAEISEEEKMALSIVSHACMSPSNSLWSMPQ